MVRIVADSTADIDAALAQELNVAVVPLKVLFGEESYRDGEDLTNEQFYQMLTEGTAFPKTSQPSPEDFLAHFEAAKQAGDSVVVLTLSAAISGTYQSAIIAKDMCGHANIFVVDSRQAVCGMRLLVEQAVSMRAQGLDASVIAERLAGMRDRVRLYAIVDTLEYLYKGGRLSRTGHIAGTLLNIKPIISLEEGVLIVAGKARGQGKALQFVLDKLSAGNGASRDLPIYFGYTATPDFMNALRQAVQQQLGDMQERISSVGSVIGTHLGPGAALISFLERESAGE